MARPLRIEFENAFYHVMNRGADRKNIYNNDEHKDCFLSLLLDAHNLFEIEIHAYCLMDNHYHLLIKTPNANLSRAMRHINGIYTQKFNKSEKKDGALFRGRYKAIIVSHDEYFLNVNRYIHWNPVSAKLALLPEDYQWSSYQYYMDPNKKPSWLNVHETLSLFHGNDPVNAYKKFTDNGIDIETDNFYKKNSAIIFSNNGFRNSLLEKISDKKKANSVTDFINTKKLLKSNHIISSCANYYGITENGILSGKRGKPNLARNIAIYCCRMLMCATFSEIAKLFGFNSHSYVSDIIKEIETNKNNDKNFEKSIEHLFLFILERQTNT